MPWEYLQAPHGRMLADFSPEDEGEVAAISGQAVWQLDPAPDGAVGWASVTLDSGVTGLVPENYVQWRDGPPGGGLSAGGDAYADDPLLMDDELRDDDIPIDGEEEVE